MKFTLSNPANPTTRYQIAVAVPDRDRQSGPWPVVLFMDGDDQFSTAVEAYRTARSAGEVPPLLLAGVGYGASYTKPGNKRGRDYTPTASTDEPESGGAGAFLEFLTARLWPELQRRFPVRDDARGIAGHSLGSLFALYALLQERPFFDRCLASAPSVWWDNRSILCHLRRLRERQAALPGRLFLCAGEKDTASMAEDLQLLEDELGARPLAGLAVQSRRFAGRDHYDVLPDAFRAGLVALYGDGFGASPERAAGS